MATPDNEADVVHVARSATGHQLARICADYRTATDADDESAPEPHVSLTGHRGGYRLGGWVPALAGDRLKQGLRAELDRLWSDHRATDDDATGPPDEPLADDRASGDSVDHDPIGADTTRAEPTTHAKPTRVDALMAMVERALSDPMIGPERAEKYLTMIHVELDGTIRLDDGTPIDLETFTRAMRASSVSWLLSLRGTPLWQTHKTRTPNRALRRALRARDRHCTYPGCGNTGYFESHHITPYAQQAEAGLDGLVRLCGFHHRRLHQRGERLVRDAAGRIVVRRSDGTTWIGTHPPPDTPNPPPSIRPPSADPGPPIFSPTMPATSSSNASSPPGPTPTDRPIARGRFRVLLSGTMMWNNRSNGR